MIALTYLLQTEMHFVFIAAMLDHVSISPFVLIAKFVFGWKLNFLILYSLNLKIMCVYWC